jgi:hypothetical protein
VEICFRVFELLPKKETVIMRGLEQERPSCQAGASQSRLCRLENEVLGNTGGIEALDGALNRATAALLHRKNKPRLIIDLDATEDPAHDKQEGMPIMVVLPRMVSSRFGAAPVRATVWGPG